MLTRGFDDLKDAAVEADGVATRAERDPVKIHGCCVRCLHCDLNTRRQSADRHPSPPVPRVWVFRSLQAQSIDVAGDLPAERWQVGRCACDPRGESAP
jgi:hypothetical protein